MSGFVVVKTEKELAQALKNNREEIVIEGDLTRKVIRIRATGKVAWGVAIGAITIAVLCTLISGGSGAPASALVGGTAAASVLGLPEAISAFLVAVAAGGPGVLNSLRKYKEVSRKEKKLVLRRK